MRAYLIVPPDEPASFDEIRRSPAAALVLDAQRARDELWTSAAELRERSGTLLYARVATNSATEFERGLSAAAKARVDAIVLPAASARDIARLGARLAVHEAEFSQRDGRTRIIALVVSARGALTVAGFANASPRLAAIGWDARAVAADLGSTTFDDAGSWTAPLAQVRGLVRLAAAAAGVEAVDDVVPAAGEASTLAGLSEARAAGFGAILTDDAALARRLHVCP